MPVTLKDGNGAPFTVADKTQADGSHVEAALIYAQNPAGPGSDALPVTAAQPLPVQDQSQPLTGQTLASGTGIVGWLSRLAQIFTTQSVRQNAGFTAPGQSIKNYTGSFPTSATVVTTVPLETVTAGKTYVITDIYISANNATPFEIRIQANGVDIFRGWLKGDTAPISLAGLESQPNASAGQAVTILLPIVSTAPQVSFFIGGFEQ